MPMSDDARGLIQATRTFPGTAENCGRARSWVRSLLLAYPSIRDSVELVVSELFTNAIRHTASGEPGGAVRVTVRTEGDPPVLLRLEITDEGRREPMPAQVARAMLPPEDAQSGRGLFIASALSYACGRLPASNGEVHPAAPTFQHRHGSMITWAEFALRSELQMAASP